MPVFEITGPDGAKYRVTAPEGATEQDALNRVRATSVAGDMQRSYSAMPAGELATTAISNIPSSASKFAENMAQPFIHPIETVKNLASIGKGVLQKTGLMSGEDATKYADAVGAFLVARYGSKEAIYETLATDPVGLAADISMVLTGGGTAAARAPGIVGRLGEAAGTVGRIIDPVNIAAAGAKGAGYAANAVTGGTLAPRATAAAEVSRALQRDAMTPQGAEAAGQALSADRPGATLADVGGENVRGLTERVAQTPGAGRTTVVPFLTARQEQQANRIADDLSQLTGTKESAFQAVTQTMAQRQAQGRPLYDQAMNFNARADADIVKAWDEATSTGWGKSILSSGTLRRNIQSEYGIKDIAVAPLMRVIDAWKKTADDMVGAAVRAGNKNTARTISETRDSVLDVVKQKNPGYQQALSAWAGKSKYLDAVEDGKGILSSKLSSEELTANFAKLGASEQEAFRIGAVSAITSKFRNDPAKLSDVTKYLRSDEVRAKVAAIMPSKAAADAWNRRLGFEIGSSELVGQSLKNSATARRLAEMQDGKGILGDLVLDTLAGTPALGIFKRVIGGGAKKIRDTFRSRTDAELAKMLTRSPRGLSATLTPRPILPPLPYRGIARGAFQAGRLGNVAQ
jgi:hypothetical protein